jgi:hypothetical protein
MKAKHSNDNRDALINHHSHSHLARPTLKKDQANSFSSERTLDSQGHSVQPRF